MIIDLKYRLEYDDIPKEEFAYALDGIFALSSAVDKTCGIMSYKPMIEKMMGDNPSLTKEQIWYLTILNILKLRSKNCGALYLESLIKQVITRYKGDNPPEDIALLVGQINNTIPTEGLFVSVCESINDDDIIVNKIAALKDEIRVSCEKYFQLKNLRGPFVENTIGKHNLKNEYIKPFDLIFDVLLMFLTNTAEEIFSQDKEYDEMETRAMIFGDVEKFARGTFSKNVNKIADNICSTIAKYQISLEGDNEDESENEEDEESNETNE